MVDVKRTHRLLALGCASSIVLAGCSSGTSQRNNSSPTTVEPSRSSPSTSSPLATTASTTSPVAFVADAGLRLAGKIAPSDGFDQPTFLAVDLPRRRLYVTDAKHGRVVSTGLDGSDEVDILQDGKPFEFISHGELGAVDVAADGSLFVTASGASRIVHVTPQGKVLSVLEKSGGYGRLFSASVDRAHRLVYAVDDVSAEIVVFNDTGTVVRTLAGPGAEAGKLADPGSVEVLSDGTFWIADAGGGRAQHLAPDGSVLKVIGPFSTGEAGYVKYPNDVAVDKAGRIWLADNRDGGVVAYRPDGTPIGRFARSLLTEPNSLAFDDAGRLYVSDTDHNMVFVFEVTAT